jgi:hypothetical protein
MYDGLGNNKAQRFRRFFLILLLIAGLLAYGFNSHAIKISLGIDKTFSAEK